MIEILKESHESVVGFEAHGKLTTADYKTVLIPKLEAVIKEYKLARALFAMSSDFRGWELCAMWEDCKFGMKHWKDFSKLALVGAPWYVRWMTYLFSWTFPGELKLFDLAKQDDAWKWVES